MLESSKTKMAWVAVTLLVVLAAAIVLGIATGDSGARDANVSTDGEPVDAAFTYFDGTEGSLAQLRGKAVVLNFWASWCPACVAEMADFQQVSQQFAGRVEFLGMNMQEVSLDSALTLVEVTGVDYPLAHDLAGSIFQMFGGVAMPTTVFITASGEVARVHAGALFADDLVALIESELLAS